MIFKITNKKNTTKLLLFSLVACMSFGAFDFSIANNTNKAIAIGKHTSIYSGNSQYQAAINLFTTLKGKESDSNFAVKYAKAMEKILEDYLQQNSHKLSSEKKSLFTILSALLKDHYETFATAKSPTPANNTTPAKTQNIKHHPNTKIHYTSNYADTNNALNEDFENFFDENHNNVPVPEKKECLKVVPGYSIDDFWRDAGSNPKNRAYLEKKMREKNAFCDWTYYTKEAFSRQLRVAEEVNKVIDFSDSDEEKIEKIFKYIVNKAIYRPYPGYERGSPEDVAWQKANREVYDPAYTIENWEGVCASLNWLYADMLLMAGISASVQRVEGLENTTGLGHTYIHINGRVSDITGALGTRRGPFESQWTTIKPGVRGYYMSNNLNAEPKSKN